MLVRVSSFLEWDAKGDNQSKDTSLPPMAVNRGPVLRKKMFMSSFQVSDYAISRGDAVWVLYYSWYCASFNFSCLTQPYENRHGDGFICFTVSLPQALSI
jgi:hypothetical protein